MLNNYICDGKNFAGKVSPVRPWSWANSPTLLENCQDDFESQVFVG
jgi:hypothetical protein